MKLKSRILGISAAAVMATGLVAAPAFAAAPSGTGGPTYAGPTYAVLGSCSGLLMGTVKSPTPGVGLTAQPAPYSMSLKGYPYQASGNTFGTCQFNTRLNSTAGTSAVAVTKSGVKLGTAKGACHSDNTDTTRKPNTGQIKMEYAGGSFQGYVTVVGFDTDSVNKVWLSGIISKGDMVGTLLGGNDWFLPMAKTKLNPTGYIGGTGWDADPVLGDGAVPLTPNYGTSFGYLAGTALGCQTGGDANITGIAVGAGITDPVLSAVTDGVQFLG